MRRSGSGSGASPADCEPESRCVKPAHLSAIPALVAVLGLVAAMGAVSREAAPVAVDEAPRPVAGGSRIAPAKPARLSGARPAQLASPPPVEAAPAAASQNRTASVPTPAKSEVGLPRDYRPAASGPLDEQELGEHIASQMPLERAQLESLRLRYMGLPDRIEDLLERYELPEGDFAYEQALEGLCLEIETVLVDCHRDYYANLRFPHRPAAGVPLRARPVGDSQFTTHGLFVAGGWYVDAGFRSADYPELERKLSQALALRIERVDYLERELGGP
jgi:hypothetical protein